MVESAGARRERWSWRPRVLRSSGSVTEGIYGLILATAMITVAREYDAANAGRIAVTVLVTAVVFWLAHVYARVLARSMERDHLLTRAEVRDVLRHDWPLVEVTLPLVGVLLLGALDILRDQAAVLVALLLALAELAASGAWVARASGASAGVTVLSAVVAVALGTAVVLLKVLVH